MDGAGDRSSESPPHSPAPNHHNARTGAVPPPGTIILALPAQNRHPHSATPPHHDAQPLCSPPTFDSPPRRQIVLALEAARPEDRWSYIETRALIEAWGILYLAFPDALNKKQWQEVVDAVAKADGKANPPKTLSQCKNRIDALKNMYKNQKSKSPRSSWPFLNLLERFIGDLSINIPPYPAPPQPSVLKSRHSPPRSEFGGHDSFPETTSMQNRRRPEGQAAGAMSGVQQLTEAITRYGDTYERLETSKMQQAVEMQKQRMKFEQEIEMQRTQFIKDTLAGLSQDQASSSQKQKQDPGN